MTYTSKQATFSILLLQEFCRENFTDLSPTIMNISIHKISLLAAQKHKFSPSKFPLISKYVPLHHWTGPPDSLHSVHPDKRKTKAYDSPLLAGCTYQGFGSRIGVRAGEVSLVRTNPVELDELVQKTRTTRCYGTGVIDRVFLQ